MHVQTIIEAGWIMPMVPKGVILERHSLLMNDGKVVALIPSNQTNDVEADEVIRLPQHIILPGMVNAHTHAPMHLLRGMGADLPLMDWLQTKIWPAEGKLMSHEFCYEGSLIAGAEMLESGITCASDHYFFSEDVARGLTEAGLKCSVSGIVIGFPSAMAKTTDDYIRCAEALFEQFKSHDKVRVTVGPHAPYTVDDDALIKVRELSEKHNAYIHMHVDETASEIEGSMKQYGMRPIQRLHKLGLLSNRFISVHTVHPDASEMALLFKAGASVVHCPCSNLKLASGFAPVAQMMSMGINVAMGTDGVASNDKVDLLGETRLGAMLGKAVCQDTTQMKVTDMLYAATMGGAKALGWDDRIGSLEKGKDADLIAVDLGDIDALPVFDPASQLLYSAGREDITHVWVDGRLVVKKQQRDGLRPLSRENAQKITKTWQNRI
jgi:5-methylthioadenosine/S-adenosylhomocysteine deaminase